MNIHIDNNELIEVATGLIYRAFVEQKQPIQGANEARQLVKVLTDKERKYVRFVCRTSTARGTANKLKCHTAKNATLPM
jgi:hypothetical protein